MVSWENHQTHYGDPADFELTETGLALPPKGWIKSVFDNTKPKICFTTLFSNVETHRSNPSGAPSNSGRETQLQ